MRCPYCHAVYTLEESCFCLPSMPELNPSRSIRVDVPWGEAGPAWSLVPDLTRNEEGAVAAWLSRWLPPAALA